MSEPREFWIHGDAFEERPKSDDPLFPKYEIIHVIEYTAYEKLQKENEVLRLGLEYPIDHRYYKDMCVADIAHKALTIADEIKEGK